MIDDNENYRFLASLYSSRQPNRYQQTIAMPPTIGFRLAW